jgi:hypothetical protein
VTESEARDLLRQHDGWGRIEAWIAGRRWKTAPNGWTVEGELQGWQFQVEPIPGGLQVNAATPGAAPATWVVSVR